MSLLYEFQVIYRHKPAAQASAVLNWPSIESAPVQSMLVRSEKAEGAKALVEAAPGVSVVSVGPGWPLVDWNKPVFTLQEAAVFLGVSERTLRDYQAAGKIPKPQHDGRTLLRIDDLERYRVKMMNLPVPAKPT